MFELPMLVALAIGACLNVYALTGGADFGGGVWDLMAFGPRAKAQRDAIAKALGPIWEANHVWLIVVIVLLFSCFPRAFAAISTSLHIPLTLMLLGIVARGAAFVFRSYDSPDAPSQRLWGPIFAIASTVTPVTLGVCAGAVASGGVAIDANSGLPIGGFVDPWFGPFPLVIGGMTLALFALLAAAYLAVESKDHPALQRDFRLRGLAASAAVGALALGAFLLSGEHAPNIRDGLAGQPWSLPFQIVTGIAALTTIIALWRRSYSVARLAAGAQVSLILWGWMAAQYPFILPPDLTIAAAAAPDVVLKTVLMALVVGSVLLVPSFVYLFKVFKGQSSA